MRRLLPLVTLAATLCASVAPAAADATILIVNNNAAGVGFNDPTPAAPVGGNAGTTLGEQRLIAFQHAANLWGATLDSAVTIQVLSTFEPLSCTATAAVLGSAGARTVWRDFPGATLPGMWHPQALANKLAGVQLNTSTPNADISARFNVNLGNPGCLTGIGWYYGLDANHGTQVDLVAVVLHELGHGLGFQQFSSLTTGNYLSGFPDVYLRNLYDNTVGLTWDQMTSTQRLASRLNARRLVWMGDQVATEAPDVLDAGMPLLMVSSPGAIAGDYPVGTAQFGPALSTPGVSGSLVRALDPADAAGPTTFDGCSPLTNAAEVAGNVALIDRGTCGFVVKVANAQAAGATAVVIADNAPGAPPAGLGGVDPAITIPSVRITITDGNAIKAQLAGGVSVTLGVDPGVLRGADRAGRVQMNAPDPVVSGSSISHWDPVAFPNQLMEPNINGDLTHSVTGVDLTLAQMRDIGWYPDEDVDGVEDSADNCPADANPGQEDLDGDTIGDLCDPDDDNDGVDDTDDLCPTVVPDLGLDADQDGCTDTLDNLKGIVSALDLKPNVTNGLLAKLNEAKKAIARGSNYVAVNKLFDFIDQVEGLRGSSIDDATADLLVTYARNLIRLFGGPRQPRDGGGGTI